MRKRLEKKVNDLEQKNIQISSSTAEQIEADDETFDYVVASLVCCSIADLEAGLLEIRRVLKQEGSFVFLEHVAAAHGTSRRG